MIQPAVKKPTVRYTGIFATGITGCGKSVLMDSLKALLDPRSTKNWIMRVEMSDVIAWGKTLQTDLGQKIRDSMSLSDKGKFLPEELIIELFPLYLEANMPIGRPQHVLVLGSGVPRTTQQRRILQAFDTSCILHQIASEEVARRSVIQRYHKSHPEIRRSDDSGGEVVFLEKLSEYKNFTLPAIELLKTQNGDVLELSRNDELTKRHMQTLEYLLSLGERSPLKKRAINRAQNRLRKNDHPVHNLFHNILNPQPVLTAAATGATA